MLYSSSRIKKNSNFRLQNNLNQQKMKNLKTLPFCLLTCFIAGIFLLSSTESSAQKSNFTGNWVFNAAKSVVPENGFGGATKLVVTQDDLNLSSDKTMKGRDGEDMISKEKIALDGKECENVVFGSMKRKSIASWSADGKILTIKGVMVFDANGESMEIKSIETWKLSADLSSLTIESSIATPNGDMKSTNVYEKAK